MVDDLLASLALEAKDTIFARSRKWIRPSSGTTAMLRYDSDMSSRDFCVGLLEETGVLVTPGSAMDAVGYPRIGYAGNIDELTSGLHLISHFLNRASGRARYNSDTYSRGFAELRAERSVVTCSCCQP